MTAVLHAHVRQMRERALVRAWEYRQRNLSKGVWFRLRRVLADAAQVLAASDEVANDLESRGYQPLPIGAELEPKKRLFLVDDPMSFDVSACRSMPVRLGQEFLRARNLILVPFPRDDSPFGSDRS